MYSLDIAYFLFAAPQFRAASVVDPAMSSHISLASLQGLGTAMTPRSIIRTDRRLRSHLLSELTFSFRVTLNF